MKEKPTDGSQYFGAFPSDHIPKVMKEIKLYLFIHSNKSLKLYQRIPVNYISKLKFLKLLHIPLRAMQYFSIANKKINWLPKHSFTTPQSLSLVVLIAIQVLISTAVQPSSCSMFH